LRNRGITIMSAAARTSMTMMTTMIMVTAMTVTATRTRIAEPDVRQFRHRRLERGEPAEDRPRQHLDLRGRSRRLGAAGRKSADPARGQGLTRRNPGGGDRARRARAARLRFSVRLPRRFRPAARA